MPALRIEPLDAQHWIPEPNTGCWLWLRSVDKNGYAIVGKGQRRRRIARVLCDAQPGEVACHHCDTPSCINPEHLYRGTWQSNMDDKVARGRWKGGPQSRFTPEQRRAICADQRMYKIIAPEYGVTPSMIGMIKRGERLREVK